MVAGRSFQFTKAITRQPAASVVDGLREGEGVNPDVVKFAKQHAAYVSALKQAGAEVTELPPLEAYPDSVFVEDTAICLKDAAIVLRPGASSRFGEAKAMRPVLQRHFSEVVDLPGAGFIDGGDVLLSDRHAFIGLSARTNITGLYALGSTLAKHGYSPVKVETPPSILHFKTECGLLDSKTIFATQAIASTRCFEDQRIILVPEGEEGAANIVRYNDVVFLSAGYPKSEALLKSEGFNTVVLDTSEAAKVDGGLSCMSLRF